MAARRSELTRRSPGLTPRRWVAVLNALKEGQTIRAACARAGIGRTTLYEAVQRNPNLAEQIEHAKNEGEARLVDAVTKSAHTGETVTTPGGQVTIKPGDWRAAAWLLEHHPHTRERYAAIQKQQIGGDPDNPSPVKVDMPVVGNYEMVERQAAIVTLMQRVGVLPIPDPDNPVINVTPEEERNGTSD